MSRAKLHRSATNHPASSEPAGAAAPDSACAPAVILRAGMAALGLQFDDAAIDRLLAYLDLLHKWNRHYNLSAVRDRQQMLRLHLLDCLAVVPSLDRRLPAGGVRILDVGSGGGLPGVVLALLRPGWSVSCADAVAKKAAFIRQVASELRIENLSAEHARVESLTLPPFDLVVCRAFSSLTDFCVLTRRHLAPGGLWLAMKGRVPHEEMASLPADVDVFHVEQLQVPGLDAQRCLVWMRPR